MSRLGHRRRWVAGGVIALFLLLLGAAGSHRTAQGQVAPNVRVNPNSVTVAPGATAEVDIDIVLNGATLGGWTVDIGYNSSLSGVPTCSNINPNGQCNANFGGTNNKARLTGFSAAGVTGTPILAHLSFPTNAAAFGSTPLTLTVVTLVDPTGAPLVNTTTSGQIAFSGVTDLSLTKTDTPDPVLAGATLTYTLTATNGGPNTATGVVVTDTLPAGVTLVSSTITPGGASCTGTTTLTCTVGQLNNAASATITIVVRPTAAGSITNNATITGQQTDPTPGNNNASATTTVNPAADLAITKTAAPNPAQLNQNVTFTITVTNNGPSSATGVSVTDTLTAGLTLVGTPTTSQGTCSGTTTITCALGTLANAGTATISITVSTAGAGSYPNTASVTATEADPNTANNSASVTVAVNSADLSITKTAAPSPATVGVPLTFTITVASAANSTTTATNVTVTDVLAASLTFGSATASQGSCTLGAANTLTCNLGSLVAGASATVSVQVTPTATGPLANTATVAADQADPNTANNSATANVTVNAVADVSITKSALPATGQVGGQLTYTLTARNNGPSSATSVVVTDTLPAGTTLVSVTPNTCTGTTTITCNLGTLTNGQTVTITIVVTLGNVTSVSNTATIANANETDPTPANNSATVVTTVTPVADIAITKSVAPNPVPLFGNATYTIGVTNNGPSAAPSVTVTDPIVGATLVSATATQGTCSGTTTVTCALGTVNSGGTATVTIVVTANDLAGLSNTATAGSTAIDPNQANNSASATAQVCAPRLCQLAPPPTGADVAITKTDTPDPVQVNQNITYQITVVNNGPQAATNVRVTDPIPASVSFVSATSSQGSCGGTAPVICNLGNLANGGTATVTIVVRATAEGVVTNTASVTANETDSNPNNNSSTATTQVGTCAGRACPPAGQVELALSKTASSRSAVVNTQFSYLLSVSNSGPATATAVTVTDALPAGVTFVSATATQGGCTGTTTVTCNLGTLAVGGVASVTITVLPVQAGPLTNTANVTSTETDSNPANNGATHTFTVAPGDSPDLFFIP